MNVAPNSYHAHDGDDNDNAAAAVISNDAASSTSVVKTLSAAPGMKMAEKKKIDTNALQISEVSVLSRQQLPNIHTNT
jgi:hypothetical protein